MATASNDLYGSFASSLAKFGETAVKTCSDSFLEVSQQGWPFAFCNVLLKSCVI